MDWLTSIAASGMRARMESLDLLANNLANANTRGYKADREFHGIYQAAEAEGNGTVDAGISPVIEKSWIDFAPGSLQNTGSPLDLAIVGDGFLTVQGPTGPLYSRNGALHLSAKGELLNADGYAIIDANGKRITLDAARPFEVDKNGRIRQGGDTIGQLDLVRFKDVRVLAKQGHSSFRLTDANVKPERTTNIEIRQGALEESNVGTAESAVRLVSIMRQFDMLQKAIGIGGDMNRKAVEEVAKPAA